MLWLKQTVLLLYFIYFCNGNNGLQKPGRSLVIVFDVTSSMTNEIEALSAGVQILMDDFVSRDNNPIENYIFVQFRDDELDPDLIPIFISSNYSDVKEKLKTLRINDGKNGDCPESCYNGIKRGLEVTNDDSIFFVITDAGTKQHELLPEIHRLIAEKRAQLYFFVSMGGCGEQDFLLDYYNLAATSNGMLFHIPVEEINDIFPTYRHLITTDGFISNSIAGPEGNSVYDIAIDKSMKEFTFTISAEEPVIQFYDPNSILVSDSQLEILLNLPNIKIIKIINPISGIWKLEIQAESQFTGQVSVISDLQFIYGFSRYEPDSLKETNPYPLKGQETFLAIQPTNPTYLNDLEYVMLVTNSTQIKHKLQRKETPDGDIFLTEAFAIPTETFKVVLHGKDPTKNIIERLLTPNIGANRLMKPGAKIIPMISVKEGESIYLICGVISAANVTTSWSKVGVNSELKSSSSIQSSILNHTIVKAELSDAGDYKCTAKNSVGVTESISKVKVLAIPLSVNIEQTSVTILTGKQFIELKCKVLPNFPTVINTTTWLFNQKTDLPQGSELNGTNLILRDIKPKFSGTYTCLAVKHTEQKSANVQLNVQYPPKFVNILNLATNTSIDITQPIGVYDKTLLNINCTAEGNPEPSIKWIKNTVESASNTSVLNINGNDVTQSGIYSCQIKSTLDEAEQKIIVDIVIPPKLLPTFEPIHKVKLGGSFKLECPLEIIPNNKLNITWFHNGTVLNQDGYLVWSKVNHDTNGEYKCVAENKAGKVDAIIHINVIYEPSILKLTKADDIETLELDPNMQKLDIFNTTTLSLTCTANGNPEPIISWIKEGNLISTGKTITINDTKFGFSGPIECSAQNELKSVARTITLNEIKIPKMQDAYQNVYNLTENQPFRVSCPVEFGEYEVTWTLNGKSLEHFKQTDNSILISSVAETGMEGNAICKATNKAGTVRANLTFDVLRAPYDLSGTANNKTTLMENKTLDITCVALGNPTPNIYWSKDNQHHSNISTISFISLQSKDTANYTCTAINILGKQSKTFEVIVDFPPRITDAADLYRTATNTNITILKLDNLPKAPVDYYSANYKKLVQFNVDDDILLKCPINGYPEPKIEWYHNRYSNILNWSNETLSFDNIAISDNGIYKCVGNNTYGQMEIVFFLSAQAQFINTNKPYEIFDHLTHQLLCVYEGFASKIRWTSSTQTIVSNSPILILSGSDTSKSGDYYCQIETDSGIKTQPLNVDIMIKVKPLDSYDNILEAQLGHPLVLECPLKEISTNKWNITWYHNGMLVHQNTVMDNKYNIPSAGHNNNGIYKCRAENKAGSMEIVLTVNVTYGPSIINVEKIDDSGTSMVDPKQNLLEIYNTSGFRLICHVNGNPNPITIWKKNNVEISMTRELNIDNLTLESVDKYQCFTKNKLNSATRDLTLKIIIKPNVLPNYPKLVKLTENTPFAMTCPMKNGDFNVKWYLNENSIDTYKQSNESIKFNVVTPNLAGEVTCIATNKAGSTKAAFKFDILMAPYDMVTTTKHNQIVNVSTNLFSITLKTTELLDLTCNAKGNPNPEIYWHKDGQQFSQEKSISIASVTSKDQGNYVCIAKNDLGQKIDTFDVIIISRPQLLDEAILNGHQGAASISMSVKNVNVAKEFFDADYQRNIQFNVGEQIKLDCRMDGNPPPEINWFKNDIRVNERNQILVKLKSTLDDAGIYKCIRTNKLGSTQVLFYINEVTNLVSNTRPIEINDQTIKYILCAYSGKTTNVKWINQYGKIISKTPVLTIDGVKADQTGEYICQMGTRDQNILVEVTVKPQLLSSYPREHYIKLGEPFTLPCPLLAVPGNKIDIKWSHNNLDLQNFNQNVSLRFASVGHSDNGIYKCTAQNKAGSVDAEIKLDVIYGPSILKIERSDGLESSIIDPNEEILEIYNTTSLSLTCHVYGNPAPSTIWKKDGIEISSTFILKVNPTSQFSGDYECFTKNALSSAVKSIKLIKIESPKALSSYSRIKELVLKKPFKMSCPMESGQYNVTWLLDDVSIDRFKQSDQTIAIDSVESKMKGEVKCIATNKAGSAFAVFDFEIFEPPFDIHATHLDLSPISDSGPYQNVILLKENDSFGLICTSGGNPLPDFRWDFNEMYLSTGNKLRFPSIQFQDSGDYMCIATNLYGTVNITYTIQVNVPIRAELKHLSKGSNKNEIYSFGLSVLNHIKISDDYFEADYQQHISIKETATLTLDCTMYGHPVPSIQWYKNNKNLNTQTSSIAISKNATIQDSGIYKCIGSQKFKKIRILFYVLVRQRFSIDSLTSSQSEYNVGDVISIYCKAKGNPIPVITLAGPKLSTTSEPTIKILSNGTNYFQQQNETFYTNKQKKIIDVKDLEKEAQYNIIKYEFGDGQFVATLNHRIKSATYDHQGTYTCSVFDRNNKADKIREKIKINMLKPPYIDVSAVKSVYFIQKSIEKFSIDCPIKGMPPPAVEWFRDTRKLSKSKTFNPIGNQLRIEKPSMTKTGEYSCKHVTTSLEYKFKIQIIERNVDLTKVKLKNFKQKDILIEKGETIQLNCTYGGNNIFWNEISDTNNKREAYLLVVNPVYTIVGDLPRTLICANKNELTYGDLFNITVLDKPKFVATDDNLKIKLGTNFSLNCEAIGNPEPTTNLYKNIAGKWEHISKVSDFQQTSKFIVTKLEAQTLDESQYKCVAENKFGNVTKKITVKVLGESDYFTNWGAWSECSTTCGNGIRKRSRHCIHPSCNFMIDSREEVCKIVDCPRHGGWSNWKYTKCTKPCLRFNTEKSLTLASRECNNPKPSLGGQPCRGQPIIPRTCYVPFCQSNMENLAYTKCAQLKHECCPDTFQYNNKTKTCEEISPCERKGPNSVCDEASQICKETGAESFRCECMPGFKSKKNKPINFRCYDINECRQNPYPCGKEKCINNPGSFYCTKQ